MKGIFKHIAFFAVLALLPAGSAVAQDVFITAPAYTASNNIGGRPLTTDSYGWVHGIDLNGEWLEYDFDLAGFGTHSARIVVKGEMGVEYRVRMELTGDVSHSIQVIDFDFTGAGFVG
jgi:hypothetical protein